MSSITTYGADWQMRINLADPVDEIADMIARFVLDLERGPARGVAGNVLDRLREAMTPADCTHGAGCTVHPDENRIHNLDTRPATGGPDTPGEPDPDMVALGLKVAGFTPEELEAMKALDLEGDPRLAQRCPSECMGEQCESSEGHAGPHRSSMCGGMRWNS